MFCTAFISDLAYWSEITMIIVIIVGIIIVALAIYLFKIKKPKDELEKNEIYGNFKRTSAKSFLPFDSIERNMIIMEDGKTFIGGITCKGIDFFSCHISEQKTIVDGYITYIGALTNPVQLRVTTKSVDVEEPIEKYKDALNSYAKRIRELYEDGLITVTNYRKTKDPVERELYENEINRINRLLEQFKWKYNHCDNIITYMKNLSSVEASKISPIREETYLFTWYFNEAEFPADITKQEIYDKANEELESMANQYIHSLSRAGVKAYRTKTNQLIELARQQMQPYGSNIYKESDIRRSNIDTPVFSSSVLEDYEKRYREALNEEIENGLTNIYSESEDIYFDEFDGVEV